jgi:hypothetical protein
MAGVSCDTYSATSSAYSVVLVKRHRDFGTHDFGDAETRRSRQRWMVERGAFNQFGDVFGGLLHNWEAVLASLGQEVKKGRFFHRTQGFLGTVVVAAATVK